MFTLDPELESAVGKLKAARGKYTESHCVNGVSGVRAMYKVLDNLPAEPCEKAPSGYKDVEIRLVDIQTRDGVSITARWVTNKENHRDRAVVYIHGGGMIIGTAADSDETVSRYAQATGVNILSVDYRLSPEFRYPVPLNDCFDSLKWLVCHAAALEVDPDCISVMGESSGGCLAAATALMARDEGINLNRQLLIYPMLDCETRTADKAISPYLTWTEDDNTTGWQAYLGDLYGKKEIPGYASPARCENLENAAPAYIEIAELDLFRNEDINYCMRLLKAGVPTEAVLHSAVPHSFDSLAPNALVSQRAFNDRCRILSE